MTKAPVILLVLSGHWQRSGLADRQRTHSHAFLPCPVFCFYFYFYQIGKLTSCVDGLTSLGDSPFRGLGYIVKQAGAAGGMDVKVNDVSARIVDIPFAKRLLDTVTA